MLERVVIGKKQKDVPNTLHVNGEVLSDSNMVADAFNTYFSEVVKQLKAERITEESCKFMLTA